MNSSACIIAGHISIWLLAIFQFYRKIGNFSFDFMEWYCQYPQTDSETEKIYLSVWSHIYYDVTFQNNNICYEGLDKHCHYYCILFYQTRCYTSDNVCLDLQDCLYSIYIYLGYRFYWWMKPEITKKTATNHWQSWSQRYINYTSLL